MIFCMIGTIVFEILGFVSIIPLVEVGMKVGEPSEIGIIFGKTLDYFNIEKKLKYIKSEAKNTIKNCS